MVHESLRSLRLDRRLHHRRGWVSEQELEKELARLPDVSEKVAPLTEAPEQESGESPPSAPRAGEEV